MDLEDLEVKGVKGFAMAGESSGLRVRVEDHPERRDKRAQFFRAVRALEKQIPRARHEEECIIVDPRLLRIYAGAEHSSLGEASVSGWTWDLPSCTQALGDKLDHARLRKDNLFDQR